MLNWISPAYTKTQVKNAGKRIRSGNHEYEDIQIVENWRASHAYILNTFQSNLRNRSRGKNTVVAQRLKRRNTIFDKLIREPNMQLSTMHDIAGCRVIFRVVDDLYAFRSSMHMSRFKHKLLHGVDRYDYIKNPKETGYRGVHDVYEYEALYSGGHPWDGLRIEIQYRTIFQHAWATAVEVADVLTNKRIKFNDGEDRYKDFFRHASEIISRAHEGQKSCLPSLGDIDLVRSFLEIDREVGLMRLFKNLKQSRHYTSFRTNMILIFEIEDFRKSKTLEPKSLKIEPYENIKKAITRYGELEKQYGDEADIVLVRGEDEMSIRDAFRNYFSDTTDFVKYVTDGVAILNV